MESGRYHLYTGNACPWCHRCLLALAARGLSEHVSVGQLQVTRAGGELVAVPAGALPVPVSDRLYQDLFAPASTTRS